jgi:hypothetical protein
MHRVLRRRRLQTRAHVRLGAVRAAWMALAGRVARGQTRVYFLAK